MRKSSFKFIAFALVIVLSTSMLSGCNVDETIGGISAESLANANDVRDFYVEELKYNDIIQRTVKAVSDTVEFMAVDNATKDELFNKSIEIQNLMNGAEYQSHTYLTKQMYEYVKSILGDKVLTNPTCVDAKKTRDMFLIDVKYDMSFSSGVGTITDGAKYLGVHGVYRRKLNGESYIDQAYLNKVSGSYNDAVAAEQARINIGLAGATGEENYSGTTYIDLTTENYAKYNNVFGAAMSEIAAMPDLGTVFWKASPEGSLSGTAIIPEGGNGLAEFGFDRASMKGEAIVRYIFKKEKDTQQIHFDNVYVLSHKFTKGVPAFEKLDIFPEFAEKSIGITVERADRAICNGDIAGMSNGKIFANKAFAIHHGNKQLYTRQVKYSNKIVEYTKRKNRIWLVKTELNSTEEVKYANKGPATYRDTCYIAFEQYGNSFIIIDMMTIAREPLTEPELNYANNNDNRYAYLYNSGNVSDESKNAIKKFMASYYKKCSNKDWEGMAKSFSKDTTMVSKEKRSEMYYEAKGLMDKAEGDSKADYSGAITEWLGGSSDPQVEFTTVELCKLPNGKALEITKYYLVSVFNDVWVIDDMKELSSVELQSEADIKEVEKDIKGYNK